MKRRLAETLPPWGKLLCALALGGFAGQRLVTPAVHAREERAGSVTPNDGVRAGVAARGVLAGAMRAELERSMSQLVLPNRAPAYYGAYWLVDFEQRYAAASRGVIVSSSSDIGRRIGVELRVGSPALDNSNFANMNSGPEMLAADRLVRAPLGDDPEVLRRAFWLLSDSHYREAVALFDQKQAQRSSEVDLDTRPPDFSAQPLTALAGPPVPALPTQLALRQIAEEASAIFSTFPAVESSSVAVVATRLERLLVASAGQVSTEPSWSVDFRIDASTQASDGMQLSQQANVFVSEGAADTGRGSVMMAARQIAQQLSETRDAPLVDDYLGPVLFEGVAAPQIAYEFLAMSLSGTGQGDAGQAVWERKIGKRVLPESFTVYDDPTLRSLHGLPLFGHYVMDDEGVAAERVSLVKRGRLESLLMSRTPNRALPTSNGHGRSGLSGWARGMLGNLIVDGGRGERPQALRQRLLRVVAEEGGAYGIVVQSLEPRGFATGGMSPPVPTRVIQLYPDGREVLVRGASFGEMNLRDLRAILASGSTPHAYHLRVEWPSGLSSPTSVVCPDLLFEEIEIEKPKLSFSRPRVLPRPKAQ